MNLFRLIEAQIAARSQMYMNSSREAFERGKMRAQGVGELPAYPGDGQTACLVNCKCEWVFEPTETGVNCYWKLNPAEHCDDCLNNAARWNPLVKAQVPEEYPSLSSDDEREMHAAGMDLSGQWVRGLSDDEYAAFRAYSSHDFALINGWLRGQVEASAAQQARAALIDQSLVRAPLGQNLSVYRSASDDFLNYVRGLGEGGTFVDDAYVSTSLNRHAVSFGEGFQIAVPEGIEGAYIGDISLSPGEFEVLLRRGLRFRVETIPDVMLDEPIRLLIIP